MRLPNKKTLALATVFLAIIIAAAFFRFENLGKQSYWMDEGYTVNAVISGLQNGTRHFAEILDSGRTYFCPMYCAPTKWIIKIFSHLEPLDSHSGPGPGIQLESNQAVSSSNVAAKLDTGVRRYDEVVGAISPTPFRLFSAVCGLLMVILFFWFAKKAFKDNRVAFLAAFFTAFSYWQIAWSRQARWYTEYELFFWLALFCAYWATDDRKNSPFPSDASPLSTAGKSESDQTSDLFSKEGLEGTTGVKNPGSVNFFSASLWKEPAPYAIRGRVGRVLRTTLALIFAALATVTHNLGYGLFAIIGVYVTLFAGRKNSPLPLFSKEGLSKASLFKGRVGRVLSAVVIVAIIATITITLEAASGFRFSRALINKISFNYELPYYLSFYLKNYWFLILLSLYGFFSAPKNHKPIYWLVFLPILGYLAALSFLTSIVQYRYLFAPIAGLFITGAAGAVTVVSSFRAYVVASVQGKAELSSMRNHGASLETLRSLSALRDDNTTSEHRKNSPFPLLPKRGLETVPGASLFKEPAPYAIRGRVGRVFSVGVVVVFIVIFFASGEGIIMPQPFYALESDAYSASRPSWVYTPQPDFNAAYAYIKNNLKPTDIVIASHPHFNKIFLGQPGYWIKFDYLGLDKVPDTVTNGKEYYVGATTINNLDELKKLMANHHGYLVFDYQSQDNRIPQDILSYIYLNATEVFANTVNSFSKIWVYRF